MSTIGAAGARVMKPVDRRGGSGNRIISILFLFSSTKRSRPANNIISPRIFLLRATGRCELAQHQARQCTTTPSNIHPPRPKDHHPAQRRTSVDRFSLGLAARQRAKGWQREPQAFLHTPKASYLHYTSDFNVFAYLFVLEPQPHHEELS